MCSDVRPISGGVVAEPVRVRGLTDQEGQKLRQIVRWGSTGSVRYRRAMMLLASVGGNRAPVIAQLVQADKGTVRDVIHRFNEIGLACPDRPSAEGRPSPPAQSRRRGLRHQGRPPPDPANSASPPLAGRSANSPPTCGKSTAASSASAASRYGPCSPAAASPSNAPRPGRSHPTPTATPNSTASSTSWTASPTASSRSTSSDRSASAPPPNRVGLPPVTPSGTPRPTTAPTASGTSTAATPSATTPSGASTAARRAPRTPWPY
jgi:Winged helix-turn helix